MTAEQGAGAAAIGPPVYLRPDVFLAQLHPDRPKAVIITVGVYSDDAYEKRTAYLDLVFEDGQSKRNRLREIEQMVTSLAAEQSVIDGTHPNLSQLTDDQKADAIASATRNVAYYSSEIAKRQSVITGTLESLIGTSDPETALQQKVKASVGALCTAILLRLKAIESDYMGIDVPAIMAQFAIPDVA